MLKLTLITVGSFPKGPFSTIGDEFTKRLQKFVLLTQKSVSSAEKLLDAVPEGDAVIILDAAGDQLTSEAFAKRIGRYEDEGRHVSVLLGGPFGIPDEIKKQADLLLSLSPMTTTHDMAHLFFLEQLYRACTINHGITYHY